MTLHDQIKAQIVASAGWLPFDAYMQAALYAPGQGYYSQSAKTRPRFGGLPEQGSDFITAPMLSPLFGQCIAQQALQFFQHSAQADGYHLWEFGAGTGALAVQLLSALPSVLDAPLHYHIVELSAALQEQQAAQLAPWSGRVTWHSTLPRQLPGFIVGNEVLDAMPVKLLARLQGTWHERGVGLTGPQQTLVFSDRATALRPPIAIAGEHDYVTEIHPQARAFIRTVAQAMNHAQAAGQVSMALWIDYGFPQAEYYHAQRDRGTLMCHARHRSDDQPLTHPGAKDITSHIDFTAIALAAQDSGMELLGYTSQAHFLWNCGLGALLQVADLKTRVATHRLIAEHEMGELFKAIAFGPQWLALCGFAQGERGHRLG